MPNHGLYQTARSAVSLIGNFLGAAGDPCRSACKIGKGGDDMFFIFGSPRSGTTLLAQCLNSHSEIIVPDETDFIIPLAFIFDRIREPDLGKEILIELITHSVAFQTSIGEYLHEEQIFKIINNCDYHPAQMLNSLYAELATTVGKKIAGDKSPNDLLFLRMLIKVGGLDDANMKILHIVRDIRDVMVSLNKVKWVTDLDLYFPRFWSNSNLYLYSLYKDKTTTYLLIRYEDMVREPARIFHKICDFLEVDFQQGMLDFRNFASRYKDFPAHTKLYAPISTDNIGVYKKEVTKPLLKSYEQQAQEALEIFEYSLEQKKPYFDIIKDKFRNLIQ